MVAYSQNHTYQDINLNLGETWTIIGTLNKDSAPITIDDNTMIYFKLVSPKALILNLGLNSDIVITDIPTAAYKIVVQPSQQKNTTNLIPGMYRYELSVSFGDGTISIQAQGNANIYGSISSQYPNS